MLSFNTDSFPMYPHTLIYSHTNLHLLPFSNLMHCPFWLRLVPSSKFLMPYSRVLLIITFSLYLLPSIVLALSNCSFLVTYSNLFLKRKSTRPTKKSHNTMSLLSHQSLFFPWHYFPTCLFSLSQFLHFLFTFEQLKSGPPWLPAQNDVTSKQLNAVGMFY